MEESLSWGVDSGRIGGGGGVAVSLAGDGVEEGGRGPETRGR